MVITIVITLTVRYYYNDDAGVYEHDSRRVVIISFVISTGASETNL